MCTVSGNVVTLVGIGTCDVTVDQAGDDTHAAASASASFEVTKITQDVTIPGLTPTALDEETVVLPSETPGGLPLTYTAGPSDVCTVSGNVVTLVGVGTCEVVANQAGDDTHLPATATQEFEVTAIAQSLTITGLTSTALDAGPVELAATTPGGLPLTYTAGPSDVCSVSGTTITLIGVGVCNVTADQVGDATHAPATASASFAVTLIQQTITIPGLASTPLSTGTLALPAITPGGMPLTYTAGPSNVCTVSGTTITLVAPGSCSVSAHQAGDATHAWASATASFAVTRNVQTITIPGLGDVPIDATPVTLPGTTPGGLPLTYTAGPPNVCTVSGNVLTLIGEGTCTVTAHQAGDATHAPSSTTSTFVVLPAMLTLQLDLTAGQDVGGAPVVVEGENLKPNSLVRIELRSNLVLLGTVMTDANGSFRTTVYLPNVVEAGNHQVVVIGVGSDDHQVTLTEEFFVDWAGSFGEIQVQGGYEPVTAIRILDSRKAGGMLTGGSERTLTLPSGLVPSDVTGLVLNLTVTEPSGGGYFTIYPCGTTRPVAAAINFLTGETKANLVDTLYRAGDELCLYSSVDAHAVVDLQGYHGETGEGRLVPRTAVRVIDTRSSDLLAGGHVLAVPVIGAGKAPAGTTTVAINVAVTEPQGHGYLTIYPCGTDRPLASNLNFAPGQTISNEVMVEPGAGGEVCIYSSATAHVVVDLNATYHSGNGHRFTALVPGRLGDTRLSTKAIGDQAMQWTIVGASGAPAGTTAVSLNVAVTEPDADGFLTVYPCGVSRPLASNVNFVAGQTVSNHVTVTVGSNGKVCVYSSATTHVVIDVEGTYRP